MKKLATPGSPGGEGSGKSASCPCLTVEALLSLCSPFIFSSGSLFIMIYPQESLCLSSGSGEWAGGGVCIELFAAPDPL